jgi:hypothetical protein
VSLIENAIRIKTIGAGQFLLEEKRTWMCTECGGVICIHDRICSPCGKEVRNLPETI